jgi:hypothetical protein
MKAFLLVILAVCFAATAFGQITGQDTSDKLPNTGAVSQAEAVTGQLAPLIYSWTDTLVVNTAKTSKWKQIGWSPSTTAWQSNLQAMHYNPDKFTLTVTPRGSAGAGDSIAVTSIRFEVCYDTTGLACWNADSSNCFVADGNYNRSDYGVWTFEDIPAKAKAVYSARKWLYPLRVLRGAYIRTVAVNTWASSAVTTDVYLDFQLIGER